MNLRSQRREVEVEDEMDLQWKCRVLHVAHHKYQLYDSMISQKVSNIVEMFESATEYVKKCSKYSNVHKFSIFGFLSFVLLISTPQLVAQYQFCVQLEAILISEYISWLNLK